MTTIVLVVSTFMISALQPVSLGAQSFSFNGAEVGRQYSQEELISIFGEPDSIQYNDGESDSSTYTLRYSGDTQVSVDSGWLVGVYATSCLFVFDDAVKAGDSLDSLREYVSSAGGELRQTSESPQGTTGYSWHWNEKWDPTVAPNFFVNEDGVIVSIDVYLS